MEILRTTVQKSLYLTSGIIILTLTGIFSVFEGRVVIDNLINFSMVILILMVGGTGYMAAARTRESGTIVSATHGIIGSLITGTALALLVVVETTIDMRFVFQNLRSLSESTLTFGQTVSLAEGQVGGLLILLVASAGFGAAAAIIVNLPRRTRDTLLISIGLMVIIGLVSRQINTVITLPDSLALLFTFALGYFVAVASSGRTLAHQIGIGFGVGGVIGIVLTIVANNGGLESGGILRGARTMPTILALSTNAFPGVFILIMSVIGAAGALSARASKAIHDSALYFFAGLFVLGIVNWQRTMTPLAALVVFGIFAAVMWLVPQLSRRAETSFEKISTRDQRTIQHAAIFGVLVIMLFVPSFMGLYISNVFNLIALYAVMGIGLNVMVGYTGLLDLGYVASFAIGAYTLGILTTPNLITCGGVHPNDIPLPQIAETCTGVTTFWLAWPFCVFFSALTGMLLGIPVLRLRGDYLAIVTLGFGEIINRIIISNDFKPLLGSAQGITPIPSPVLNLTALNPEWHMQLNNSTSIYYLFLFGLISSAFVVLRLVNTRLGRAWRAIRDDEDVAQAMGIDRVRYKLLAFGISSAFAGLGGAAFAASVQGIFPNSFTLLVSINVLSLIIIGGMGSIPGIIVGAMILIGLPELLRELDAYRLFAFGALLVTVMIVRPQGLVPPTPPRLEEAAQEYRLQEEASHG
jgi:ABC-type branched-subunit amino acid transport system permease subunit